MKSSPAAEKQTRRGFFGAGVALAFAALYAVPGVAAIVAVLSPLRQKGRAGQFVRLATLAALPEDGTPRKFPVVADRTDAWNYYPAEPIGTVYLCRQGERVEALHSRCPHAGCPLAYDAQSRQYYCPCHTQPHFDLCGKRIDPAHSQAPRDMDLLEVEIRNGAEVWVKFENFRENSSEKIART